MKVSKCEICGEYEKPGQNQLTESITVSGRGGATIELNATITVMPIPPATNYDICAECFDKCLRKVRRATG